MTAAVTLEGTAGRAVRLDMRHAPDPFRDSIVDDWTLYPDRGVSWTLLVATQDDAYLLCLARVDPLRALVGMLLRRAATYGVEFALAVEIQPDSLTHAREIARAMAKAWAGGALPVPPTTPRDRETWQLMTHLMVAGTRPLASEKA